MATYYVKLAADGGNDSLAGTSPSTAWATIGKALGATGISSGDTVYIAPGTYIESVTVGMTSATATTSIIADPTSSQFPGMSAAPVRWQAYNTAGTSVTLASRLCTATSKNYLSFSNFYFESNNLSSPATMFNLTTCRFASFTNCVFTQNGKSTTTAVTNTAPSSVSLGATFSRCIFAGGNIALNLTGQNVADTTSITNCLFVGVTADGVGISNLQASIYNCTFLNNNGGVSSGGGSATFKTTVRNCLFQNCNPGIYSNNVTVVIDENYNRFIGCTTNTTNTGTLGANSTGTGAVGIDFGYTLLTGLNNLQIATSSASSPNTSFGTSTSAPVTDIYGVTWTGSSPDAGSGTYRVITSNPTNITYNGGIDRNASTITIAPGSTSQSIELYLGATGLTASTSGLSARYNRTRTASVSIPLVARTIAQAWTSGGFAEVDATNMPGIYRLDLPDAALAAGADDVTIVVRGASGTNGAVMTVKLSSGGLTSAQTATAVWGASPVGYNDSTTLGGVLNETNQLAGSIDQEVGDVAANVWDEFRTNHTTAGTFGQYVNAELVTPVTSAALVRMGPYEVKADGLGASDPLDIQKGAQHGVDIQCVDAFGSGIDITSATVTANVYNSGATLVDTYACTATYAADGRATFTIDTTVTNTPGTYTATITRTTGASDTQVFGPLRIYVRDI